MNKLIKLLIIILFVVIAVLTLYYYVNKDSINVSNQELEVTNINKVRLGERKDKELIFNSQLFKTYEEYTEFMDNYDVEKQLTENSFEKNDYILDFQEFSKCGEEKDKEITDINIEESVITINYNVYNRCNTCSEDEKEYVAYIIPIKKNSLKALIPINNKLKNVYTNLKC